MPQVLGGTEYCTEYFPYENEFLGRWVFQVSGVLAAANTLMHSELRSTVLYPILRNFEIFSI